jgi:hypothetical protein
MKSLSTVMILLGLFLTACTAGGILNPIDGNGKLQTEEREIADFSRIEFSGNGDLDIQISETSSLSISAEENLLPYLRTVVEGDTLRISTEDNVSLDPNTRITYSISSTSLNAVSMSGMGNITIGTLETESLRVELSGAGNITITDLQAEAFYLQLSGTGLVTINGTATEQSIELSGAGNYEASNFATETTRVSLSGLGNTNLRVSESLEGSMSGLGNLSYFGSPRVTVDRSGLGNISQAEG